MKNALEIASKKDSRVPEQPQVSIVLPTRNAAATLGACLQSVRSLHYPHIEVIVADNYSRDATRIIAEKYSAKVVVCGPPPPLNDYFTAPAQRRIGAELTKGEFIFFIDADMVLEADLVEECVMKCLKGADAVAVPEVSFGEGFWTACRILERMCYFGDGISDTNIQACRFIRKTSYESVGGWGGKTGSFDDWDLTARLRRFGFVIVRSEGRIFHNEGHITLKRAAMKQYHQGKASGVLQYLLTSGASVTAVLAQLTPLRALILLKKLPFVTKSPRYIAGILILKAIDTLAFGFGLIVNISRRSKINLKTRKQLALLLPSI